MRSHSKTRSYDAPNFEKPADADKDNVYEVTITATDGNANMATRDVKVTVTNAEEAREGNPVSDPAAGRTGDNRGLQRSRRRVGQRHVAVVEDPGGNNLGAPLRSLVRLPDLAGLADNGDWLDDCRCDFGHLHAG